MNGPNFWGFQAIVRHFPISKFYSIYGRCWEEGSNFRFLAWQKSYQPAILGLNRTPICSLPYFGLFFNILGLCIAHPHSFLLNNLVIIVLRDIRKSRTLQYTMYANFVAKHEKNEWRIRKLEEMNRWYPSNVIS